MNLSRIFRTFFLSSILFVSTLSFSQNKSNNILTYNSYCSHEDTNFYRIFAEYRIAVNANKTFSVSKNSYPIEFCAINVGEFYAYEFYRKNIKKIKKEQKAFKKNTFTDCSDYCSQNLSHEDGYKLKNQFYMNDCVRNNPSLSVQFKHSITLFNALRRDIENLEMKQGFKVKQFNTINRDCE